MGKSLSFNRRLTRRLVAFWVVLACIVTLLPQGSLALMAATETIAAPDIVTKGGSNQLWVDGSSYSDNNTYDAIKWRKKDSSGKYYLYLPTAVDLSKLVVWHTFSGTVKVGSTVIESGKATSAFKGGGDFTLTANNNEYKIKVYQSENINTMFITTASGSLDAVNKSAKHTATDSGTIVYVDKKGKAANVELAQIKGRGNSSWNATQEIAAFCKYPYNLKLGKKTSLYGMAKSKKWALLANIFDQSLIRNKLIFDMAADAGMPYTPESEFVDVYQNGRYIGNYLITSKVDVESTRVDIPDLEGETEKVNGVEDLSVYSRGGDVYSTSPGTYKYYNIPKNPSDITAGYLLEFDLDERFTESASGFVTNKGQQINVESPEYASKQQVEYIRNFYQEMEDAVYSTSGYNSKGKHYTQYIDITSAAMMYIIEELTMDVDAVATSFFLYKGDDGKLHCGPVWDFDWSMGNYGLRGLTNVNYWYVKEKHIYYNHSVVSSSRDLNFLGRLCQHSEFMTEVDRMWQTTFYPLIKVAYGAKTAFSSKLMSIDKYASTIEKSANMNFSWFEGILGSTYWGSAYTGSDYATNVRKLKEFVSNRAAVMNNSFKALGNTFEVDKGSPMTIYYNNSLTKWSEVYAYVFSDTLQAMTVKGTKVAGTDNIYKFTVSDARTGVLFKNTEGIYIWDKKTADATLSKNSQNCFTPYSGDNKTSGTWVAFSEATPTPTVTATPAPVEETTIVEFLYDNQGKTAGADLDEYTDGVDTYTYKATTGEGTLTGTITGSELKHASWSKDEYVNTAGISCGIQPAFGASKTNKWSANAAVTIKTSAKGYERMTATLSLAATKKGPANYVIYVTDGTNTEEIGKISLTVNKTLTTGTFAIPSTFNGKEISLVVKLVDTTTVGGTDLSAAPTGGEFAINCVTIKGYSDGSAPVITKTPTVTATPVVTAVPTPAPTEDPSKYYTTIYYNTTWTQAYCHYKVNGQWTVVPGVLMEATTEQAGYQWKFVLDTSDSENIYVCFNNGLGQWDSKSGANYTIPVGTYGVSGGNIYKLTPVVTAAPTKAPTATPTVVPTKAPTAVPTVAPTVASTVEPTQVPTAKPTAEPTVEPTVAPNTVTVYYYKASMTNLAYIHYKVSDGAWTVAPGAKMEKTGDVSGYTWKYTIDLGTKDSAIVCFNNGSGSWDSNGGKNYTVYAGNYGVKDGKVTKLTVGPTTEPTQAPEKWTLYYDNSLTKWTEVYAYTFTYKYGSPVFETVTGVKVTDNVYKYEVSSDYDYVLFKNLDGTTAWDKQTADQLIPTDGSNMFVPYTGANKTDGTWKTYVGPTDGPVVTETPVQTATPQPTNGPVVTTVPTVAPTATPVITTTEEPETNKLVVYYQRYQVTSWKDAYVHYKVNGKWTTSPGVKMTKISDGYWKIEIDLGTTESAILCFNNGSGSWDSNGGKNYTLQKGTYLVDQTTGKVSGMN
ncbi:MAG: CotH kinase family protein [Lachnospiraceae bacterium]|nr:CotH kinase family protein [Lachnospiraceae bacterium]